MRLLLRLLTRGSLGSALLTIVAIAIVGSLLSDAGVPFLGSLVTLLVVGAGLVVVARLLLGR